MAQDISPEELQRILDTTAVVEANAQLLMQKTREVQLKASQLEACLALVVGLLSNSPDPEGAFVIQHMARQLTLCAQDPEMTANVVGCDPTHISGEMLQATADFLGRAEPELSPDLGLEPHTTMH
ncbi:hypothetical protein [Phenylobacterium aquaticum]|jgi:hypothetical protein|uniref:hypothetical protein n=1 Tax=Phenylobacterium aquaticum TaxID=1763816 RepID=UPI001F5C4566|nr:hypothetical protein [Phenylobacterium aquaticum]MCI3131236.1 hypothetical protein [Phenylobacterium aquaticum]